MSSFSVGDKVAWTSQSGGFTTNKIGTVIAVVPDGEDRRGRVPNEYQHCERMFDALFREGESYIVHVPNRSGKGHGKLYWPKVSQLSLFEESM